MHAAVLPSCMSVNSTILRQPGSYTENFVNGSEIEPFLYGNVTVLVLLLGREFFPAVSMNIGALTVHTIDFRE